MCTELYFLAVARKWSWRLCIPHTRGTPGMIGCIPGMKAGGAVGAMFTHRCVRGTNAVLTSSGETLTVPSRQPHFRFQATANHRHGSSWVPGRSTAVCMSKADLFGVVDREVVGRLAGRWGHETGGVGRSRGVEGTVVHRWHASYQRRRFVAATVDIVRLLSFQLLQVALNLLHRNLHIHNQKTALYILRSTLQCC